MEGPGYVARVTTPCGGTVLCYHGNIFLQEAMELAIRKGRYGYGNVFVFASGNGGINDDNCNFDGYANSIYTITIGRVVLQDTLQDKVFTTVIPLSHQEQ